MLNTPDRTPLRATIGATIVTLIACVTCATASLPARADDDFVRTTMDNGRVTVQATKPGSAGAGGTSTGSSGKGVSGAKPIVAGTTITLVPDHQLSGLSHANQALIPECWNGTQDTTGCTPATATDPTTPTRPATPTRADAEAIARTLISRLQLPEPQPHLGPDPSLNEWNMAVVGVPYWIWTDTPTTLTTRVTGYGITITLNATRTHLTLTPGDGTTHTCTTTTPYPTTAAIGATSPTCGHTYTWPSRTKTTPHGTYPLSLTAHWNIHWTALGHTGTIPTTTTATHDLPVTELHALARVPSHPTTDTPHAR